MSKQAEADSFLLLNGQCAGTGDKAFAYAHIICVQRIEGPFAAACLVHAASKYVETGLALADTAMGGISALGSSRQPLDCVLVVTAVLPRPLPGSRGGDARGDDWVPGR